MTFIKLYLRILSGYHSSDPDAYESTMVNINKIDCYYPDGDGEVGKSSVIINGKTFRCRESVDEITEKIELAKIADSVK